MTIQKFGTQLGIRVEIALGRRLLSVLLNVFLPTLLLNVMGHASVYFPRFYFEAIITVNLTVMLVLTTLYVGVSDALPKTAYIKMIDIWFIFCMIIPFLEVLLQTYIEHLRTISEENMVVNHHGNIRQIDNGDRKNSLPKDQVMKISEMVDEKNKGMKESEIQPPKKIAFAFDKPEQIHDR